MTGQPRPSGPGGDGPRVEDGDPSPDCAAGGRRAELADGLARTRERIAAACSAAGRDPAEVTLVVVTKTFPASDVRVLASLGIRDVGENKVQEAAEKAGQAAYDGLRLHLIGRLQSNKASAAGELADAVHALDRARLVAPLARGAQRAGRLGPLPVLLQISLDGDPARGGCDPDAVSPLAEAVAGTPALRLAGVMAVPPPHADPRRAFTRLSELASRVRAVDPGAAWISAGMSADLEAAIGCGATHLRVGSAILGSRPSLR